MDLNMVVENSNNPILFNKKIKILRRRIQRYFEIVGGGDHLQNIMTQFNVNLWLMLSFV